jgi:hypothetical protein
MGGGGSRNKKCRFVVFRRTFRTTRTNERGGRIAGQRHATAMRRIIIIHRHHHHRRGGGINNSRPCCNLAASTELACLDEAVADRERVLGHRLPQEVYIPEVRRLPRQIVGVHDVGQAGQMAVRVIVDYSCRGIFSRAAAPAANAARRRRCPEIVVVPR